MKPRVYLAGPIFGQSDATCNDWRSKFTSCDMFEWLDPMRRDYRGKEDESVEAIVDGDKEDIDGCDALIAKVNPVSAGTSMEILWAWLNHTPVIVIFEGRLSPWIRYHAADVCANEETALNRLKAMFA